VDFSGKDRSAGHLWLGEVVATVGLLTLIFALARSDRAAVAPAAVGAYIGAAYWFTSSTSFANPAWSVPHHAPLEHASLRLPPRFRSGIPTVISRRVSGSQVRQTGRRSARR
jgi:hypothetical protein